MHSMREVHYTKWKLAGLLRGAQPAVRTAYSVAVRVRQVRKRGAVRTRQGTERSQQCSSGRAVFATAPCSVIRFRLPMPDVTVWVQRGGVQRRRRSRGRRRSGTGSGRRPQQAPGARSLQAEVLRLREELHLLAGDFGSFTARLPELLVEHGRRQQKRSTHL